MKSVKRKKVECAYAAGLFDGEGCVTIGLNRNGKGIRYHTLKAGVTSTDPRVITWLLEHFGGSSFMRLPINGDNRIRSRRICHEWRALQGDQEAFLNAIRPYLVIKAQQVDIALAYIALKKGRTGRALPLKVQLAREGFRQELHTLNGGKGRWNDAAFVPTLSA